MPLTRDGGGAIGPEGSERTLTKCCLGKKRRMLTRRKEGRDKLKDIWMVLQDSSRGGKSRLSA